MDIKRNKRTLYILIVLIVAVVTGIVVYLGKSDKNTTKSEMPIDGLTIFIKEDGFIPSSLTVTEGAAVVFVNKDTYWHWPASDPHPSHAFYPELDPKKPIKPGDSWSVTLTKPGAWGIHDHLAPYVTGTITVEGSNEK